MPSALPSVPLSGLRVDRIDEQNRSQEQGDGPGKVAEPLVGVIRNPKSHRNKGKPLEMADCASVLNRSPKTHEELGAALDEFAARGIAYLAIDGGDGTVRDVLSCGASRFGDNWPTLIVLPKGKTNALTVDLGTPREWHLDQAMAAARQGRLLKRQPLAVVPADGGETIYGFLFGAGVFTLATDAGQDAHRLGAFNSIAVGLTIVWTLLQVLFGGKGNPWRACTRIRMAHAETGQPLAHGPHGPADERFIVLISTFERFPLGIRPFGSGLTSAIKLSLIDRPMRRVMGLMPLFLLGFFPGVMRRNGAHRIAAGAIDMEIEGPFIVDGEAYPAGRYRIEPGPELSFVTA